MEEWQTCSLLLTINVGSTPEDQWHSGHPQFIKTFPFNIASVITQNLTSHPEHLARTSSTGIYLLLICNTSKTKVYAHRYIVWNFLPLGKMKNHGGRGENGSIELGQEVGERGREEERREQKGKKPEGKRKLS